IAGLGAVFQHQVTQHTTSALAASGQAHAVQSAAHGKLGALLVSGEVSTIFHALPSVARGALAHSYRVGFTEAFTSVLTIAAGVALLGALLAFTLVRSSDFVTPQQDVSEPAGVSEPLEAASA